MKHIDLFSGIGGFSLAVDTVWHEEENEHLFIEWDTFCTEVLKKHWPQATYFSDIKRFVTDTEQHKYRAGQGTLSKKEEIPGIYRETLDTRQFSRADLLTGGFPCQPFSQAGPRRGTSDDRYLWPEMFRVIQLYQPTWVIAENVSGLVTWSEGMVLEQVCTDLENEGYEVQPFIIPACAVNAPHRRDRVWIIAHRKSRWYRGSKQKRSNTRQPKVSSRGGYRDATNTHNTRSGTSRHKTLSNREKSSKKREYSQFGSGRQNSHAQNAKRKRSRGWMEDNGQILERKSTEIEDAR